MQIFFIYLKSATKPFNVLFACTRPIITELSDTYKRINSKKEEGVS